NSYSGGTTISAGVLQVGSGSTTGTLGSGTVTNNATLTFNRSNTYTVANTITGSGAVIQSGGGTTILTSASNDYAGTTTVSGGTLQVGNLGTGKTGTGNITVQTGANLSGTGIVQGTNFTAQSGSIIQPGNGTSLSDHGTLTFTPTTAGTITFDTGSSLVLGISTPNVADPTFGGNEIGSPGYYSYLDGFTGTGTGSHDLLAFGGPSGSSVVFNGNIAVVGSNYTVQGGDVFKLLDWSATIAANFSGFNAGANLRDGSSDNGFQFDLPDISSSGLVWDISRFTSSGVIAVTPEPARALLMLLGLTSLALRRRRK
ncbi:MAG: autotransporter outer rane beta-barrel protein, partial [Verrucomicrobiaceae bacterium]|nr:autotransporter outer rane beta-barrel protein [Verrucomicrobiaceae bacterium]